ncbi:MAG: prepilin-type N-terminal cleavage/methylation domain-containing protein [Bacilli bacterium]
MEVGSEKKENQNKKGFTMVEVLVVVAIIAVLATTIIPIVSNYIQKGKDDYNEKLKKQLLVSGKDYFTNNKVKLPVKTYLGTYKDGKDYSYVSLSELLS